MRTSSLLLSFPVALILSCGGEPPPDPQVPISTQTGGKTVVAAADLSAVPEPAGLAGYIEAVSPRALLETASSWVGMPIPVPTNLGRELTGEEVGDVVDLGKPVFAAVAFDGTENPKSPKERAAVSVGLSADARAAIERKFDLTQSGGIWMLGPKDAKKATKTRGDADEDDDDYKPHRHCAIAPSYEPTTKIPGLRLVCGDKDDSVTALAGYLTRTAPRRTFTADAHAEFRVDPVRTYLDQAKAAAPLLAVALGSKGVRHPALVAMVTSGFEDLIESGMDLEGISMDAFAKPEGLSFSTTLSAKTRLGTLTKMMVTKSKYGSPLASVGRLPLDAHSVMALGGFEASTLDGLKEDAHKLVKELVSDNKDEKGKTIAWLNADFAKNANELIDGIHTLSSGYVVAHGSDPDAGKKAAPVAKNAYAPPPPDFGAGWSVGRFQEPLAAIAPMVDRASRILKPELLKTLSDKVGKGTSFSISKSRPGAASLPKGSLAYDVTITVTPEPYAPMTAPGKKAQPLVKSAPITTRIHYYLVPDGNGTIVGWGVNDALVLKKLATVVTGNPAETLASRAGIDALKGADGGGFLTVDAFGSMVKRYLGGGGDTAISSLGGNTPITIASHADASGSGGKWKFDIVIPKKSVGEAAVLYGVARNGGAGE